MTGWRGLHARGNGRQGAIGGTEGGEAWAGDRSWGPHAKLNEVREFMCSSAAATATVPCSFPSLKLPPHSPSTKYPAPSITQRRETPTRVKTWRYLEGRLVNVDLV